jgi:ribosomal protein S12 methylthiotransferase accessory factor
MEITKHRADGAHRACTPEQTLERMRPHFHAAGITRLAEITGLDRIGICVAQCIRPDAIVLAVDSGKGATPAAAKCSAMMEGFERHVGETSHVPHFTATASSLGQSAETRLPLLNGAAFNPNIPIRWGVAQGIKSGAAKHLPLAAIHLTARGPADEPLAASMFSCTSNGLSAGNTYAEAICGGLYEVIERDQVAIGMENPKPVPRVDLDTITDSTLSGIVRRLRQADLMPVLFDCTSDIGVPTYTAYIYDTEERGVGFYRGYAAHLDPAVAQCRALCEAIQGRLVYIAGSRDDILHERYQATKDSDTAHNLGRLLAVKDVVSSRAHPDRSGDTFEEDIDTLLSLLAAAGIPEPLVHEFTHDYPCAVVRVIIPTLEGYYNRHIARGSRARRNG